MSKVTSFGTPAAAREEAAQLAYMRQVMAARWRFPDGTVKRFINTTVGDLDAIDDGTAVCLDEEPPMPASMRRKYGGDVGQS